MAKKILKITILALIVVIIFTAVKFNLNNDQKLSPDNLNLITQNIPNDTERETTKWETTKIVTLIKKYKPIFAANKEKLTPPGEKDYILKTGTGKVLLTAPHAVNHIRNGMVKINEYCTGPIVSVLSELTGAHILYLNYYSQDPNYYDDTPFKQALADFILSQNIKLVLDIHGAKDDYGWDIDLGDINGTSLINYKDLKQNLSDIFKKNGIYNISNNYFPGGEEQNTIVKFISSRFKIDAMQMEIAKKYRCEDDEKTAALVKALGEIITQYNMLSY